jgi:YHS domain-containing protein
MEVAPEPVLLGRKPMAVGNTRTSTTVIDPICEMTVDLATAAATREVDGVIYGFCSLGCATRFDEQHQHPKES